MEDEVKVVDSTEIDICASSKRDICVFCNQNLSKYTCPRCNASYCTAACYKSENHVQCSEDFYRQSVMCEISSRVRNPKDIHNVLEMLKTLEEQDQSLKESDVPSLEERFANTNLQSADIDEIWNALSLDEKREFDASIQTGNISHLIKQWIPWWQKDQQRSTNNGIEVITTSNREETRHLHQSQHYPKVLQDIPVLSASFNNSLIKYSIVDVLYAYVYVMRMFNGDAEENLCDAVMILYRLASTLSKNIHFESVETVVHNSLNAVIEYKDIQNSQEFSYHILLDVCELLLGCYSVGEQTIAFVDCALSHVCSLLTTCRKALKSEQGSENEDVKRLFLAKKKVKFFLSWRQSNSSTLCSLVPELKAVHSELINTLKFHKTQSKEIGEKLKGKAFSSKKLIEEL